MWYYRLLAWHGLCRLYALLSRIRVCREYALFFMSCPDFYSDIEDFAQILCRYLLKKLAFGTSAWYANKFNDFTERVSCPRFDINLVHSFTAPVNKVSQRQVLLGISRSSNKILVILVLAQTFLILSVFGILILSVMLVGRELFEKPSNLRQHIQKS